MRRAILAGAAVVLLLGIGLGVVVAKLEQGRDVRGSATDEFVTSDEPDPKPPPDPPPAPPPSPTTPGKPPKPARNTTLSWPTYGYATSRVRISPYDHRPPFKRRWLFRGRQLLEFPPSIAYGRLYGSNNPGLTFAVDTRTGKTVWRKEIGRCTASTPAIARRLVIQSYLNRPPCNARGSAFELDGEVIAFDADTGRIRWRTRLGPTESSPLVLGRRVFVGDWRGDIVALDLRTGRRLWDYRTADKVKGAVSASGNRVFAASYDGHLYALNARTGALQWRSSSQGGLRGRGNFYSTPAIAYGRVFIGSTDGKVYAFGAGSGRLLWSRSTGGFVYSSPAVWQRTVFAGSYSGRLHALDAATGDTRWTFAAGSAISGAPTVMAGQVWFSTLARRTYVVGARTGRQMWSFPDGGYTPLVADADRAYLVGYARVYALDPA